MQSDFAVNKCLRIVASSWTFLLTLIFKFNFQNRVFCMKFISGFPKKKTLRYNDFVLPGYIDLSSMPALPNDQLDAQKF